MPAHPQSLVPALFLPYLAWRIYRRFHRNVGRQPLRKARLVTGIVVFGLISVLLIAVTFMAPSLIAGFGGGLLLGGPLALWGLTLTRFETDSFGKRYYTPNTYIGIALTLLLAARVVYRVGVLYFSGSDVASTSPAFMQSPLTLLLLGLTAGYYVTYNAGVLIRSGRSLQ